MHTAAELRAQFELKSAQLNAILAMQNPTDEDMVTAKTLDGELEAMKAQIQTAASYEQIKARASANNTWLNAPSGTMPHADTEPRQDTKDVADAIKSIVLPRRSTFGELKNWGFRQDDRDLAAKTAYAFGRWIAAVATRSPRHVAWCKDHGFVLDYMDDELKAQTEASNTGGGYLVPEQFENQLIVLRENYGVMRQAMTVVPMSSDTTMIPRRTGGLTTYYIDENTTITESSLAFDQVRLVAKKLGALGTWSSEVAEDAVISMADRLAGEIAYAFALAEDKAALLGDGTSSYGGIVGFRKAIMNLTGTIANIAGAVVQTGTGGYTTTLSDYQKVVAKLPQYADTPNACWIMSRSTWASCAQVAELAQGGVTSTEVINGVRQLRFLGYPVKISQVMPVAYVTSDPFCLFGDFGLAGKFGDRRMTTIAASEHANFAKDQLTIRGTERYDVKIHDVGNQSATAASRVPGPVCALVSGTS